jgi:KDO2-lipid IV(A) lauroyltransferase
MIVLLKLICGFLALLPHGAAMAVGRGLGWIAGSLFRFRRREAVAAMRRAFPEKSAAEISSLARRMYRHFGLTMVEVARASVLGKAALAGRAVVVQDENYQRVAGHPGGVLLLMGHIGNWEFMTPITDLLSKQVKAIVKPLQPAALQDYVVRTRAELGLRLINFRGQFGDALRLLKRGDILAVILDQNQRRNMGVFVDFLGCPACTSPGLAVLSALSRAPVFPIFTRRRPDGVHEIRFLPPFDPPADRQPETLRQATQQYTRALEDIIRQYPDQWTWIHRRWKTRPVEAEDRGQRTEDSQP